MTKDNDLVKQLEAARLDAEYAYAYPAWMRAGQPGPISCNWRPSYQRWWPPVRRIYWKET